MTRYPIALYSLAAVFLSGCMVGPKYVKPTVPLAPSYKETAPPADSFKEDPNWHPAQPADTALRSDWWTIFGDPQLNELEPKVAAANQDLKAAEARFRQARALIQYSRSGLAPTIGVSPAVGGERASANRPYFNKANGSNSLADLQLPFDFNYEIDLWGRIRHGVSAAREQAQASAADMQTALLSLQAELAIDYFEARSAD